MNDTLDALCPECGGKQTDPVAVGTRYLVIGNRFKFRAHHYRPGVGRDLDDPVYSPDKFLRRRLIFSAGFRQMLIADAVFVQQSLLREWRMIQFLSPLYDI